MTQADGRFCISENCMRCHHFTRVATFLALTLAAFVGRGNALDLLQIAESSPSDHVATCEDGSCVIPCNLCPCDYIVLEGLMMQRDNQGLNNPLVQNINSGATLLSVGDLNFDMASGFRIYGGRKFNDCWTLEVGYFGLWGPTANATVVQTNEILIPGDLGLAVNNFNSADQVHVEYTSQIQGTEANIILCNACGDCDRYCQSIEWIGGVRYLSLTEGFSLTSTDSAESVSTYRIHTQNNLYGGQLGARIRRCYGRLSLEGTGKAAAFYNDANQAQDPILDFPTGGGPDFVYRDRRSASDTTTSFVGELSLTGVYQLNGVWGLRAGYNLLWIENVALAPDQLDFTDTLASGTTINTDGGVFVHGLSAGIEARW